MPAQIAVIVPCLDEEAALGKVLEALPRDPWDLRVIVVDNGSRDRSAEVARAHGAEVVREPRRGYGSACLRGLRELDDEDCVVFLDADFSDDPSQLPELVAPILSGQADLVIGSRTLDPAARKALLPQARLGNRLATWLLRWWYRQPASDLGPFRAIRRDALERLEMRDRGYGWTVEMQAKAALLGLRTVEVPVRYRARIGRSKISGTLRGSLKAGAKILWTLLALRLGIRRPSRAV